jgi:hypothetical protein
MTGDPRDDRDAERRITAGADWIELVPRPGWGELRRMVEDEPGSGEFWLDGWPSNWGIQHRGSHETGDYEVTACDPPGGPWVSLGTELITHSGRRVRVVSISDSWRQITVLTEPA